MYPDPEYGGHLMSMFVIFTACLCVKKEVYSLKEATQSETVSSSMHINTRNIKRLQRKNLLKNF